MESELKYVFIGEDDRIYGHVVVPGEGTLVAHPGDVREWDEPPTDGRWLPVPKAAKPDKQAEESK